MLKIWGRANSVNVQKVLWCCDELGLPFERVDAGLQFGRVNDPDYRELNPNGQVPTLVDGAFVLWESNAIVRYLAMQYGASSALYPSEPKLRASIDRWLDWSLSTLAPAERPVFMTLVRTPAQDRDMIALASNLKTLVVRWKVLDAHLQGRFHIEGDRFTLADIVLGAFAKRWFGVEGIDRPPMPSLERWYQRLTQRAPFKKYIDLPLT
ncbi:MAG TPA: glutathione S-transferase family protein [Trinickia sp.]|jgi:glutathione S-transferase|uniref:glutathione S-transferase family protein n=1 Tax=Trinickia sp. TaxID=2571163 RepID=UPI002C0AC9BD|nr:glutathione S-transferase family protein [Trinickia sp.]HVW50068.1 glutathione S-transferase family protein [Trinickia sp.]